MTKRRRAQAVVVALAAGAALLPTPAAMVERWYSGALYPALQRVLTPVSNLVPFALFDLILVGAVALAVAVLWRGVARARRRKQVPPVLGAVADTATLGAILYLLFLLMWGLNYRRAPVTDRLIVGPAPPAAAAMTLGLEAVSQANRLYSEAHAAGWRGEEWRNPSLRDAMAATQRVLGDPTPAQVGRLKWTMFGPYFRWAGIDGMTDPFALEVIGNPDLLPWERPFVAAHEWAHLAGYAHEAEASFVGWLVCMRADVQAKYSGWLFLYWELAARMPQAERQRLSAMLDPGPASDLEAIAERLRRGHVPALQRASWQVYDQYLRANRVEEGVRSYGEVVDLILRARFDEGWVPVRRPVR